MTTADDDKTNGDAPKLSPIQEQFLRQRIAWLEHQIMLLGLGKKGIARVAEQLRDECDTHRRSLGLDPMPTPTPQAIKSPKPPALVALDGRPLGEKK